MTSYFNKGYDVINYFVKFEKCIPHSIIIPKFYDYRKSNARVRLGGGFFAPPYKIGSQNTPYKLGLKWNGTFRDFISLILEFKGNWELNIRINMKSILLKRLSQKFKITWWPSSKTFIIQGSESSKVIKMVENILNLPEESENELAANASTKSTPKSKKRSRNKSKSRLNA